MQGMSGNRITLPNVEDKPAGGLFVSKITKSTCRIQNPDIQRAGRVGAHGGAAGRGRAEQFAQETNDPRTLQGIEDTSPERLPRSTNKRNPM